MKILLSLSLMFFFLLACTSGKVKQADADYYYTCSMHPQIVEDHPGTCPICHMDLIRVKRTQSAPNEISLNEEQMRLGNITTDTIREGRLGNREVLPATVSPDESLTEAIAARVPGRIDQLFFKSTGSFVAKGAPLFSLYSEALNNARQDYRIAVQKKKELDNSIMNFDGLIAAAKEKLLLLGMSATDIKALNQDGPISDHVIYHSPVAGYLMELPVTEGDYVSEGSLIMKLADLSRVWVEAQVYASQAPTLHEGVEVNIEFPSLPGVTMQGRVSFVSPEILPDSRIALVRVEVPNPKGLLSPGMAAYVIAKTAPQEGLVLPSNAVIRDAGKSIVWVRTAKETFQWREVTTGAESNQQVAILSGLHEGDVVVVSGAYLLNSEYLLKKGHSEEHAH